MINLRCIDKHDRKYLDIYTTNTLDLGCCLHLEFTSLQALANQIQQFSTTPLIGPHPMIAPRVVERQKVVNTLN